LINDIKSISKEFGVDGYEVAEAIAVDVRIGEKLLWSGVGWGDSCFGKDTEMIRTTAHEHRHE
jgi:UDPglucose 6-dehydrogenase